MKIRTGYSYYGQDIGILVNASQAPRVPGDAGHAQTFAYPVRYQITGTSFMDLVEGSAETREKILSASRALKDARGYGGSWPIAGSCRCISRTWPGRSAFPL